MGQGVQIDSLPHSCGTSDALKVFKQPDGEVNGFCYRCGQFVQDPYGGKGVPTNLPEKKVKTAEEIAAELADIATYKTVDVEARKLRKSSLEKFEVKVALSERDGKTPTALYFPMKQGGKLQGYHVKMINAPSHYTKAYNIGNSKDIDLLNWDNAKASGAYQLIITEGPEDMVSVDRIFELHDKDSQWHPAVVSLPFGATSAKHFITKHAEDIKRLFKKVTLSFDDDEAGEKAIKDAMLVLPNAISVKLPYKDANECLQQGKAKAAYNLLKWSDTQAKNTSLTFASEIHFKARQPAKWGELSYPFSKLNDLTRGIRYGETAYFGGGVKTGKGELRDEIAAHLIKEHNAKVFMASFEQSLNQTYKRLAGKLASRIFHDPKIEFDYDAYDKAGYYLKDNLALLDVYQQASVENFRNDIVTAAEWGAKAVFIDPITNFTNGIDPSTTNTILQGMSQSLAFLAKDLEIFIGIFCHLKEPEGNLGKDAREAAYKNGRFRGLGNCPHETGGTVLSAQFAGSRGMMRSCNYMIGLQANKDPELPEDIRNMRDIVLLEDREFGETGIIPVFWDKRTGRFSEV